jgi:hypothetical protein
MLGRVRGSEHGRLEWDDEGESKSILKTMEGTGEEGRGVGGSEGGREGARSVTAARGG